MKKALITTVVSLLTWGSVTVLPAFAFDTDSMPLLRSNAPYHHVGHRGYPGHGWYPGHGYRPYHGGYRR